MRVFVPVSFLLGVLLLVGCQIPTPSPNLETFPESVVHVQRMSGSFVSGWILDSTHIITVRHSSGRDGMLGFKAEITFRGGEVVMGKVGWTDPRNDVAVIDVKVPTGYSPPPLYCGAVVPGQRISTVGHPVGMRWTSSFGYVANVTLPERPKWVLLQIPVAGGTSGGPVFDLQGRVVGMAQQWMHDRGRMTGFAVMLHGSILCNINVTRKD